MPGSIVVLAPDSFKGSAAADVAARALAAGWSDERPGDHLVLRPMADGGEGTVDAFALAVPGATRMPVTVLGPDGRDVTCDWLLLPDGTGVVELASASGLTLLDPLLPRDAHTYGFGQVIAAALDGGARRLLLAIGGSSSTDGGAGALAALGARFLDEAGRSVPFGGGGLEAVAEVDFRELRDLPPGGASVLTDVANPLLGPLGAAAIFGPQKGASAEDVRALDAALARLAGLLDGIDPDTPGAGAAGGAGFGLLAWGAALTPGSAAVAAALDLAGAIRGADLVVTGEGAYDEQSAAGKVPHHVAAIAAAAGVPAALVAGRIGASTESFAQAVSLTELAGSGERAQAEAEQYLRRAGAALARGFSLSRPR
ncbi:glycerate kinase family protein [Planctomonas deserti]|uniref:glycerate kinase family protein n=1 Tax=Planctomonas deserti TaxID=2144185 RepID=UPI000D3CBAC1|nr:glycerate kinase [Planctomonas deserti]